MNNLQIAGTIHHIAETQTFGSAEKPFVVKRGILKQETNNPNYPNFIEFQCVQDRINIIEHLKKGQEVVLHFDLKGRLAKDNEEKAYNNVEIWKVETPEAPEAPEAQHPPALVAKTPEPADPASDDDLPF